MTMNVLYVTDQLWDADFVEHELRKTAPNIHLDVSPRLDDASARIAVAGRYDAVLLDAALPGRESQSLVTQVREQGLPLAVVMLVAPTGEDPPLAMLEVGADDYLVKRPNFTKNLPALLQRAVERRRMEAERRVHPLQVLYAGDMTSARYYFSSASLINIEAAVFDTDGSFHLKPAVSGKLPYDAVVIDDTVPGAQVFRILKEIGARAADTPVILLVEPSQDNLSAQALKMGVSECIFKSGDFAPHLIASLDNAIRRRDLLRGIAALRSTEAHLRLLVENIPACVALLTPGGVFQAMNWAGLSLVGATRVDQVVGKNLCSLAGPKYEDELRGFLAGVCAGSRGVFRFEWNGFDDVPRRLELNAAPLRREPESAASILAVLRELVRDGIQEIAPSILIRAEAALPAKKPQGHEIAPPESDLRQGPLKDLPSVPQIQKEIEERRPSGPEPEEAERPPHEGQYVILEESLRIVKAAHANLEEEQQLSQARWEEERRKYEAERIALQAAVQEAEAKLAIAGGQEKNERDEQGAAGKEVERRCQALEEALQTAEMDYKQLLEARWIEREEWKQTREGLERKLEEAAGKPELPAESAIQPDDLHSVLVRQHQVEKSDWEVVRRELEQRCLEAERMRAELEDRVHGLTDNRTELEALRRAEKEEWEKARIEWDQRERDAEAHQVELEETIHRLTNGRAELETQNQALKEEGEKARFELGQRHREVEDQRAALTEHVRSLTDSRAELEGRHGAEKDEWAKECHELEQKQRAAEDERAKLEETIRGLMDHRAEMEARHRAEKEEWEKACLELKQRHREAEERQTALESNILNLADGRTDLAAQYQAEKEIWEQTRLELEGRRLEEEARRLRLEENVRRFTEDRADLENRCNAEREEWETIRKDFERRQSEVEEHRKEFEEHAGMLQTRLSQLEEQHRSDRDGWASERLELRRLADETESKCAEEKIHQAQLAEKLSALEACCAGLEDKYRIEKEACEKALLELERQRQEQRAGIAAFEDALKVADERVALVQKQHRIEQTGWLATRSHLQRRFETIEAELNTLQARHEAAMVQARIDREGWEAARHELVRRHEAVERIRTALAKDYQALQVRMSELEETRHGEAADWGKERQDLQLQARGLDSKVRILEQRLAESEARHEKLSEERQHERAIFEELHADLENQRLARVALEDALHVSEQRRVELQEKGQVDRADWQSAQEELDRQRKSQRALDDALREAEARLAKLVENQREEGADLAVLRRELEGQRAARVALGRVLRAAESRQTGKPAEPGDSALQIIADLVAPMVESGTQLMESLDESDPRRVTAARFVETARCAAEVVRRLLNPSHSQEAADLNAAVTQVTAQRQLQADDKVELLTIFSPRLPRILVSPLLTERLLTALLKLAGDALPLGGMITLETRFSHSDEAVEAGTIAMISATVSGCSVQLPADVSVLEHVVLECRGKMSTFGDPDTAVTVEISLPAEPVNGR